MTETDELTRATDIVEALGQGLRHRQESLLEMEVVIDRVRKGRQSPRVLLDHAEDVRRALRIQRSDQLEPVLRAVRHADQRIVDEAERGVLSPNDARTASHVANATHGAARRLQLELDEATKALSPLVHATANDPQLVESATQCVDTAVSALERARRQAWRIGQDLPLVSRTMSDLDAPPAEPVLTTTTVVHSPAVATARLHPEDRAPVPPAVHGGPAI